MAEPVPEYASLEQVYDDGGAARADTRLRLLPRTQRIAV
jgi:hypothetical protein